jgi:hypothetical protein
MNAAGRTVVVLAVIAFAGIALLIATIPAR